MLKAGLLLQNWGTGRMDLKYIENRSKRHSTHTRRNLGEHIEEIREN